jgi:hypothetical protein
MGKSYMIRIDNNPRFANIEPDDRVVYYTEILKFVNDLISNGCNLNISVDEVYEISYDEDQPAGLFINAVDALPTSVKKAIDLKLLSEEDVYDGVILNQTINCISYNDNKIKVEAPSEEKKENDGGCFIM